MQSSGWTQAAALHPCTHRAAPESARGRSSPITLGCSPGSIVFQSFPCDSHLQPGVRATLRTSGSRKWVNLKSSCQAYAQRATTSLSNPPTARVLGTRGRQRQQAQNISPIFGYGPAGRVALRNPRGSAGLGLSDRICRGPAVCWGHPQSLLRAVWVIGQSAKSFHLRREDSLEPQSSPRQVAPTLSFSHCLTNGNVSFSALDQIKQNYKGSDFPCVFRFSSCRCPFRPQLLPQPTRALEGKHSHDGNDDGCPALSSGCNQSVMLFV